MISYLKVRNLAIVEEFEIEPEPGLNVLTGETGAGKSLLIDSLEFLRGGRGASETVRTGAEKMSAEAVFQIDPTRLDAEAVAALDLDGNQLVVRRELSTSGRGRVSVNGSLLTVRELASMMEPLLEIHGQNQSHARIAGRSARELLDEYGSLQTESDSTRVAWSNWHKSYEAASALRAAQKDRALRLDLLRYQIEEISSIRLESGEDSRLREERSMLAGAHELTAATASAWTLLEDAEPSVSDLLARVSHAVAPVARSVAEMQRIHTEIEEVRDRISEVSRSIASFASEVRHDPRRLDEVEDRLAAIDRLTKKYGGSIENVLAHLETSSEEFETLNDFDSSLDRLDQQAASALELYRVAASDLSMKRAKAARLLQEAIKAELLDLAMERTSISIALSAAADPESPFEVEGRRVSIGSHGYDRVEMLIAPNLGEELRPIQKIASGGELSRIQLAIAAAVFKTSDQRAAATLIFDEIDAGVGGRVAEAVGRKLRELARSNQVICVTHLPQIASMGTAHFQVWKEELDGRTVARIKRLETREERTEEIARMLAGETLTNSALAHAGELLSHADKFVSKKKTALRSA